MHTAGRSTMHGMSWSGFVTGAVDACMMSLLLRAWWAARPEAASAGTPLGQDGRPSTCAISGPRRPPGTFDTPNYTVSSVPVGWWRSGAANWKTPVDFFYSDMKPGVFMVPRAAGSLLKKELISWWIWVLVKYPAIYIVLQGGGVTTYRGEKN